MKLIFITGNEGKWKTAQNVLGQYGIELERKKIETPEIQAMAVEEVAAFSAEYAAREIGQPVIVTDVGYYISALNGFPGPFIKFLNQTLSSEDVLGLMRQHDDRRVIIRECLAYAAPGQKTKAFTSEQYATLARKARGNGSTIDNILVLKGFKATVGSTPKDSLEGYWANKLNHYHEFGLFLSSVKN